MNIKDYSTNVSIPEEKKFLGSKLFNVNMRLFKSSEGYRDLISHTIEYMIDLINYKYDDYDAVKGISGANIGVPFNIVVVKVTDDAYEKISEEEKYVTCIGVEGLEGTFIPMINPVIKSRSKETFTTISNCGSVVLDAPIEVERHKWVVVEFYDAEGEKHIVQFGKPLTGTIQHEIEHNRGILITDKNKK
jgi:peptide deformylase